jgi:hypothetical protein
MASLDSGILAYRTTNVSSPDKVAASTTRTFGTKERLISLALSQPFGAGLPICLLCEAQDALRQRTGPCGDEHIKSLSADIDSLVPRLPTISRRYGDRRSAHARPARP